MQKRTVILDRIKKIKREVMPHARLILFGSQARNDANADSDWDLLILLDKAQREPEDLDKYTYPFIELGWEMNEHFSTKLYTLSEWEKSKPSLFYKNVQAEGIEII